MYARFKVVNRSTVEKLLAALRASIGADRGKLAPGSQSSHLGAASGLHVASGDLTVQRSKPLELLANPAT